MHGRHYRKQLSGTLSLENHGDLHRQRLRRLLKAVHIVRRWQKCPQEPYKWLQLRLIVLRSRCQGQYLLSRMTLYTF
ncbi:hypothetical protein PC116_g14439 [Phytophthora cactorum]|uniref:Uncharacterized protein n=1 Tax=Phytophthora cactorum TaxID=29920 RepID=A0A8T1D3Z4_9STRA|nr:hypothetical protein PC114_g12518 [Phytophthora cactorum]KAG2936538.1 hypothetical protein PC117_g12045 [Phytophthora cactorum]KAG3014649.1 hypothetical protein PC119_g12081 [Phytophthora cactorum]KAG3019081.1 hypothetical protein PC120_g10059 [Phytophthora cactorum]KAG3163562.1 hypothetical protein C6341_g12931 [Phytophthora cactorum]